MIINHNMASLNTYRQLNANNTNTSKSLEKLSSGLRINRAGDDAAGLAISEKMRGQIRGLDQAARNSQDAISLIQTAEGALNETHSILQRMRELAVQSATDTNTADDRAKIQAEVDELAKEITRISNTTEFNTQNLLAGGLSNTFHVGANKGQNISLNISAMDAQTLGVAGSLVSSSITAASGVTAVSQITEDLGAGAKIVVQRTAATFSATQGTIGGAITSANVATEYTGSTDVTFSLKITAVTGNRVDTIEYSRDGGTTWQTANLSGGVFELGTGSGMKLAIADDAGNAVGNVGSATFTAAKATIQLANNAGNIGSAATVRSNQSSVVVGDTTTGRTANVSFTFGTIPTTSAEVTITQTVTASSAAVIDANGNVTQEAVVQKGINVSTQYAANNAIKTIDSAIKTVSEERSKLGAYQNRLEHTIANLGTSSENLTAAESRIRDVDMAKEMMNFQKNNILSQAAQAMLAQANQQPQGVLQLLR